MAKFMPTAAKGVAAVCLGATALITSGFVKQQFPEITVWGMFDLVNILLGLICGWTMLGRRAGNGVNFAISAGFSTAIFLAFWALFVQAGYEALQLTLRRRFDGVLEFFAGMAQLMIEWAAQMASFEVLACLALGGMLSGLLMELASRRWN